MMIESVLLRVTTIEVDELFGIFHHQVNLNLDDRASILHGPNGVGKTVVLRMVHSLLNGRMGDFVKIPFRRFSLTFSDATTIDLRRQSDTGDLTLFINRGRETEQSDLVEYGNVITLAEKIANRIPFLSQVEDDMLKMIYGWMNATGRCSTLKM